MSDCGLNFLSLYTFLSVFTLYLFFFFFFGYTKVRVA